MQKIICAILAGIMLITGCAGREANTIQVRQLGDEQKTCDELLAEMNFAENEISRLMPKSDKTGKNIALGATGIIFIVPLFFMDLKQGERKEIEAYRARYNRLLTITQLKDCKLPASIAKETPEENIAVNADSQLKRCDNCGHIIGNLEKSYTFEDHTVCWGCYDKLIVQSEANTEGEGIQ